MAMSPYVHSSSWRNVLGCMTAAAWRRGAPRRGPHFRPRSRPGQARIWFYRTWLPSESLNLANIDLNGVFVGSVANGGVFYRDVPPGTYHIAPQTWARDFNQDTNVALVPGQQVYIKILDLTSWATSVSAVQDHPARLVLRLADPAGGRAGRDCDNSRLVPRAGVRSQTARISSCLNRPVAVFAHVFGHLTAALNVELSEQVMHMRLGRRQADV